MKPEELDDILAQTFDDHRLSRGEKHALREVLGDLGSQPQQLAFFRSRAFELARGNIEGDQAREVLDWLEDVVGLVAGVGEDAARHAGIAEAFFSGRNDCVGKIASLISQSRESIDACVFTITDDRLAGPLLDAHARGLNVRIITDDEKVEDRGSDIVDFVQAGIEVRTDRSKYQMHHKFAIFDNRTLLTGSYNWTRGASEHNEENFIVSEDPQLMKAFSEAFEHLWDKCA